MMAKKMIRKNIKDRIVNDFLFIKFYFILMLLVNNIKKKEKTNSRMKENIKRK